MTIKALQEATTLGEVAQLLGISHKHLVWYIYRCPIEQRYVEFSIKKKCGGERKILAPANYLKEIQRRLLAVLQEGYKPSRNVHGYIKTRSIRSNAIWHLDSTFVLNLDLKDFFGSINFGRVRGVFMAKPFLFNEKVATVLAQICCHNGALPQGAPTSSIISNLVCRGLDKDLHLKAKKFRCRYTRYSDDITFSTGLEVFPSDIATRSVSDGKLVTTLNHDLVQLIHDHDFRVQDEKTRLLGLRDRMEVTGLTVNQSPNVQRRYVRQIRAMLHDWEANSLEKASRRHFELFNSKHRNPEKSEPSYKDIVRGKLNFLRFVKGPGDPVYRRLRERFEALSPELARPKERVGLLYGTTWVIYSDSECMQGTAFWLKDFGVVTCDHAVFTDSMIYRANDPDKNKVPIEVVRRDKDRDIAVLRVLQPLSPDEDYEPVELEADFSYQIQAGDQVKIAGFPQHEDGFGIYVAEGKITQKCFDTKTWTPYWRVDCQIVAGNSGGPVLNCNNKVIGIVARGADAFDQDEQSQIYGVIPILELLKLKSDNE